MKCRCYSAARVAEMPTESTWQQCVVTRCYPSKHRHTKTVETRAGRSVGREIIAASRRCTLQSQHHLRVSCALRLVPSRCRSFSCVLQTRPVKVEVTLRHSRRGHVLRRPHSYPPPSPGTSASPSRWWRNGRVSDLRSRGRGFDSRPGRGCVTILSKLFTPSCLDVDAVR